jgi:GNAT superfamily N-acetyltransferase
MLQFVPRGQTAVTVRHGSSLDLLSKSHVCLNEEFNDTDPEKDFKKWLKKGAQPYFLAVIEPSTVMSCCLRCLLDGDWVSVVEGGAGGGTGDGAAEVANTETVGTRRLVVDYVTTLDQFQGRGYAGHLLGLVLNAAAAAGANSYVLALEDSCVYWMSKGFVLDDGPINRRLNVFPDTHLLKLPSNLQEDPACIPPEKAEGDESSDDEDEDAEDDEKTGDEGEEVQNRAQVGMHPLHQHLLSLSDKTAKWTCDGSCGRSTRKLQRFHCSEGCDFGE